MPDGVSDDVTDGSKGPLRKHILGGWDIQATRPGMDLDDENLIHAALKKKFEKMRNTREVYRRGCFVGRSIATTQRPLLSLFGSCIALSPAQRARKKPLPLCCDPLGQDVLLLLPARKNWQFGFVDLQKQFKSLERWMVFQFPLLAPLF